MRKGLFLSSFLLVTGLASQSAAEEPERPASSHHRVGWGAGLVLEGFVSMAVGSYFLASSFDPCADGWDGFGCALGNTVDRTVAIPLLATGGVKALIGIPLWVSGSSPRNPASTPMLGVGPGTLSFETAF